MESKKLPTTGFESSLKAVSHGVPQGSVLGPLLFILFINDMHTSVKHSKVHHYADGTSLLLTSNSLKKINRQINHDLSLITHWLRTNKISLNTTKTEIIIFRPKKKLSILTSESVAKKSTPVVV